MGVSNNQTILYFWLQPKESDSYVSLWTLACSLGLFILQLLTRQLYQTVHVVSLILDPYFPFICLCLFQL